MSVGKRIALKYGMLDSNVSLTLAFFINAAMLILAAAVFHFGPHANTTVADITTAYELLEPAIGKAAKLLFAIGLLASGQQATITGETLLERSIINSRCTANDFAARYRGRWCTAQSRLSAHDTCLFIQ